MFVKRFKPGYALAVVIHRLDRATNDETGISLADYLDPFQHLTMEESVDLAVPVTLYGGQDEVLCTIAVVKSFAVFLFGRLELTVHLISLSIVVFSEAFNAHAAAEVPEILKRRRIKNPFRNPKLIKYKMIMNSVP
jgi:hypothetical protein